MGFRQWLRGTPPVLSEHVKAMTDLEDKDREIDSLLEQADSLVKELRASLSQVPAALRRPAGED